MKRLLFLCIICLVVTLIPQESTAQSSVGTALFESFDFQVSPKNPEPLQDVTVTMAAYITDLTKSKITWYVNNIMVSSGVGIRNITFKAGPGGSVDVVRVVIARGDGSSLENKIEIVPSEVDILIEPQTSVPPFYRGATGPSDQSKYVIVAIPNMTYRSGKKIPNNEIYYKWKIGGDVDLDNSGVGKNSYTYTGKLISRPTDVFVEASSVNTDQVATKKKVINPAKPYLLFYEKDPVLGVLYERALVSEFTLFKKEMELFIQPFYFNQETLGNVKYKWMVDGKHFENFSNNTLPLRRVDDRPGSVYIYADIFDNMKLLQRAEQGITVRYEEYKPFEF